MQFSQGHIIYTREASLSIVMAVLRVYKRNSTFMDLAELVDQISRLGLVDALQKYHNKPLEREAKSIVAGPSFLQYLNKLFQIQLVISYNLNLEILANTTCYQQLEHGMR